MWRHSVPERSELMSVSPQASTSLRLPIEIGAAKSRKINLLLGMLGFVGLAVWMLHSGASSPRGTAIVQVIGWFGIVVFGALSGVIVSGMVRDRPMLRIHEQGFTVYPMASAPYGFRWDEILSFHVMMVSRHSLAAFTLAPEAAQAHQARNALLAFRDKVTFRHSILPQFAVSGTDLAGLLEYMRTRSPEFPEQP
jgi:hypothetical protein